MTGPVLVINSGSSSLKFGLYADRDGAERALFKGGVRNIGGEHGRLSIQDGQGRKVVDSAASHATQEEAFRRATEELAKLSRDALGAIGHRIVHGGPRLVSHQALTDDVLRTLEDSTHFAPLHIPAALVLIRATLRHHPGVPQFACFDTAFHATLPEEASTLPLPRRYRDQGVRRYGFHGLSYESIVERLKPWIPARTVVAHLGNGASLSALEHGRSVDTSMGFTPTGGVPMGTRTGDLDPGVLLWLLRTGTLDVDALESLLNHDAGLKGLSGGTSDLRALTEVAGSGETSAELALDVFTRSIAKTVGAYATVLGGLDLLVFTGGIGENSVPVRQRVCARLEHLGVRLDAAANGEAREVISATGSPCTVRVLPSDEEARIAAHTHRWLRTGRR